MGNLVSVQKRAFMAAAILLATPFVGATTAIAATDGSLGATSQGTVDITASVPSRVRLSKLTDVSLLNQDPGSDAVANQNVCVWSNTATSGYSITATGNGAGNAFTLASGTNTVPYSVEWAGVSGQNSGSALATGVASTGYTSVATQQLCNAGPSASASLIVKITSADLSTMSAGQSYTGTLTLLVAPE